MPEGSGGPEPEGLGVAVTVTVDVGVGVGVIPSVGVSDGVGVGVGVGVMTTGGTPLLSNTVMREPVDTFVPTAGVVPTTIPAGRAESTGVVETLADRPC